MLTIKNVKTLKGDVTDWEIEGPFSEEIDGEGLTLLPALIDPHVHFRTPGAEYKENWISGAQAAIAGGVTTVLDMPNNSPACCTITALQDKIQLIDSQLKEIAIPLRYGLYFGADENHLDEIPSAAPHCIGLKIYLGSSTGDLLMYDPKSLEKAFHLCSELGLVVAVHAEDEAILRQNKEKYQGQPDPALHPVIRSREAAIRASNQSIELAEKTGATLYLVHISTKEELDLVRAAKKRGVAVYAETTPQHLFLDDSAYQKLGCCAQMNPPIRTVEDQQALWHAVDDGTLDTIGTDHAPHTLEEKALPYGKAPSGIPGVETLLPLLLNAHTEGKISLERIVELTHTNPQKIFNLPSNTDVVLCDLELKQTVENALLHTRCGWSPYAGWSLRGWPVVTVLKGQVVHSIEVV